MKIHELKCWPEYFQAILDGTKTFEVRMDDRGFKVSDRLNLRECNPSSQLYTGREVFREVVYVLRGRETLGVNVGHVVMALKEVEERGPTTDMAKRFDDTAVRIKVCLNILRAHHLDSEVLEDAITVLMGNARRVRAERGEKT